MRLRVSRCAILLCALVAGCDGDEPPDGGDTTVGVACGAGGTCPAHSPPLACDPIDQTCEIPCTEACGEGADCGDSATFCRRRCGDGCVHEQTCGPTGYCYAPRPDAGSDGPRMIGPEGGTVSEDGATIEIPPGALAEPVAIRVSIVTTGYPPVPSTYRGPVWALEPHGQTFAIGVVVSLPYTGSDPSPRIVSAPLSGRWTELPGATRVGDVVSVTTDHFSVVHPCERDGTGCYTCSLYPTPPDTPPACPDGGCCFPDPMAPTQSYCVLDGQGCGPAGFDASCTAGSCGGPGPGGCGGIGQRCCGGYACLVSGAYCHESRTGDCPCVMGTTCGLGGCCLTACGAPSEPCCEPSGTCRSGAGCCNTRGGCTDERYRYCRP